MNITTTKHIAEYLEGMLSEEDRLQFETDLQQDDQMQRELKLQEFIAKQINQWGLKEEILAAERRFDRKKRRRFLWWIFSLLLLIAGVTSIDKVTVSNPYATPGEKSATYFNKASHLSLHKEREGKRSLLSDYEQQAKGSSSNNPTQDKPDDGWLVLSEEDPEVQNFFIHNERDTVILTTLHTKIRIPAFSFSHFDGRKKRGFVKLTIREYANASDYVYAGRATMSDDQSIMLNQAMDFHAYDLKENPLLLNGEAQIQAFINAPETTELKVFYQDEKGKRWEEAALMNNLKTHICYSCDALDHPSFLLSMAEDLSLDDGSYLEIVTEYDEATDKPIGVRAYDHFRIDGKKTPFDQRWKHHKGFRRFAQFMKEKDWLPGSQLKDTVRYVIYREAVDEKNTLNDVKYAVYMDHPNGRRTTRNFQRAFQDRMRHGDFEWKIRDRLSTPKKAFGWFARTLKARKKEGLVRQASNRLDGYDLWLAQTKTPHSHVVDILTQGTIGFGVYNLPSNPTKSLKIKENKHVGANVVVVVPSIKNVIRPFSLSDGWYHFGQVPVGTKVHITSIERQADDYKVANKAIRFDGSPLEINASRAMSKKGLRKFLSAYPSFNTPQGAL